MANPTDLRGLIRDSNVFGEVVDAVSECYRDGVLDYRGAMEVLLNNSTINREQNRMHERREQSDDAAPGKMLTLEEQEEDWRKWKESKGETVTDRPVTKPARATVPVARPTLQSGEWIYPEDGAPYKECLCGCGEHITSKKARFKPGHDAKLKSVAKKVLGPPTGVPEENAEFTEEQWHWLATQGYEPPEGVI